LIYRYSEIIFMKDSDWLEQVSRKRTATRPEKPWLLQNKRGQHRSSAYPGGFDRSVPNGDGFQIVNKISARKAMAAPK
jgi:hypothetical protein